MIEPALIFTPGGVRRDLHHNQEGNRYETSKKLDGFGRGAHRGYGPSAGRSCCCTTANAPPVSTNLGKSTGPHSATSAKCDTSTTSHAFRWTRCNTTWQWTRPSAIGFPSTIDAASTAFQFQD